uniref:Uncharacterized protein n=1 Tax=Gasterosteus aculeatus aculeatus TaxID=481459 RepID=A0AAQ4P8K3_GASAC
MPRSPTSSEDEMAQSFSDYSDDCASDSSREETIYETIRATAEPPAGPMDDVHANSLVVRVLVPDLQQTVAIIAGNFELAELVKNHKETDIVPFREAPAYSKRRRGPSSDNERSPSSLSAPRVLLRSNSDNNLTVSQYQQQQQGSPGNWAPHLQQH